METRDYFLGQIANGLLSNGRDLEVENLGKLSVIGLSKASAYYADKLMEQVKKEPDTWEVEHAKIMEADRDRWKALAVEAGAALQVNQYHIQGKITIKDWTRTSEVISHILTQEAGE